MPGKKRHVIGKYDNTATAAEVLYPRNGLKREEEELFLEIEERPIEKFPGGFAHGVTPTWERRTGKKFFTKK